MTPTDHWSVYGSGAGGSNVINSANGRIWRISLKKSVIHCRQGDVVIH
jgi:hypothetical protein